MVLRLKTRESRSLPGLQNATNNLLNTKLTALSQAKRAALKAVRSALNKEQKYNAGWSSPVARQAHNLKAAGSNPAPATKIYELYQQESPPIVEGFLAFNAKHTASIGSFRHHRAQASAGGRRPGTSTPSMTKTGLDVMDLDLASDAEALKHLPLWSPICLDHRNRSAEPTGLA